MKSDRVGSVLDYLAANGPTRTARVGRDLDIGQTSMNALMQYLKRRGLARKAGASPTPPHELTREGLRVRDELMRRSASPEGVIRPPASADGAESTMSRGRR